MHLDTCFLIDLQREMKAGEEGPGHAFLHRHDDQAMGLSVLVVMEYCEGFADAELLNAHRFLSVFNWVAVDHQIALRASRLRRRLRIAGKLLPDNDILVAASAIEAGVPLVTDNTEHFECIEGLLLVSYR